VPAAHDEMAGLGGGALAGVGARVGTGVGGDGGTVVEGKHAIFTSVNAPVQLWHLLSPCTGHMEPIAPWPFAQLHTLVAHTRSLVAVGAVVSYWYEAHAGACVAQKRSELSVGVVACHSPVAHEVTKRHGSSSYWAEYVTFKAHGAQMRSVVEVPSTERPSPAGHALHGRQGGKPELPDTCAPPP
jgi:hypothetical protein